MTCVFGVEFLVKVIAMGMSKYLNDNWNILDVTVVGMKLFEMVMSDSKQGIVSVLRLARVLRPLRFISRNSSMKTIVIALLDSFNGILSVLLVIVLFWSMLAIVGVNLFRNKLGYCNTPTNYGVGKT